LSAAKRAYISKKHRPLNMRYLGVLVPSPTFFYPSAQLPKWKLESGLFQQLTTL